MTFTRFGRLRALAMGAVIGISVAGLGLAQPAAAWEAPPKPVIKMVLNPAAPQPGDRVTVTMRVTANGVDVAGRGQLIHNSWQGDEAEGVRVVHVQFGGEKAHTVEWPAPLVAGEHLFQLQFTPSDLLVSDIGMYEKIIKVGNVVPPTPDPAPDAKPTVTVVTSTPRSFPGAAASARVKVCAPAGSEGVPTGQVTAVIGGAKTVAPKPTVSGRCAVSAVNFTVPRVGKHTLTVSAAAASGFTAAKATSSVTSKGWSTTTRLALSKSSVKVKTATSATVAVVVAGKGGADKPATPTGKVRVLVNGTGVGSWVSLVSGKATVRIPAQSSTGARQISVKFVPASSAQVTSTSAARTLTVTR